MEIETTRIYTEIENAVAKGYTVISEQGSSRSAKTYNTVIWLIVRCLLVPGTTVSICRATLPALKGSVQRDFIDILMNMGRYEDRCFNKSEQIYSFPNGSWVEFFSCDSEQKLRGRKRQILFVNEANELRFMEWQQLQLRTTAFTIIDYNPSFTEEHWICEVNKDPKTYHFISTYKDNPFLEKKVVEEIESLQYKNKSLWQIYGLGIQSAVEGLVFPDIEIVDEMPRRIRRFTGIDFGYSNDPTAIVDVGIDMDGEILYVDEICYRTEMLTSDIIRELKAVSGRVISESADPRLVEEIYRAGIDIHPVNKFPGSIEAGITRMKQFRIRICRNATNVLKEFRNYTYLQDKNGKWLNKPIDTYNHAIDAIRYVILEIVLGGRPKKIDTSRIARRIGR